MKTLDGPNPYGKPALHCGFMNTWKELGFSVMRDRGYYDYQKISLGSDFYHPSSLLVSVNKQTWAVYALRRSSLAHFRRYQVRHSHLTVQSALIKSKSKRENGSH